MRSTIGSLLDKSLRIDMENPIFRKLQEAVEQPCRSKDWFGMAEQAINTIYALGEHPDILCNDMIKNLTRRAFGRKPKAPAEKEKEGENKPEEKDTDPDAMDEDPSMDKSQEGSEAQEGSPKDLGDAFELSQVLFVVGHVAIKHIVFLELVEREWKRQKDEKQLGEFLHLYKL